MTPEPNPLDDDLVGEVLRGLGIERPTIDRAGLAQLYSAWCRSVPFDNVRKLIALAAGDAPRAEELYVERLKIQQEVGDRLGEADTVPRLQLVVAGGGALLPLAAVGEVWVRSRG